MPLRMTRTAMSRLARMAAGSLLIAACSGAAKTDGDAFPVDDAPVARHGAHAGGGGHPDGHADGGVLARDDGGSASDHDDAGPYDAAAARADADADAYTERCSLEVVCTLSGCRCNAGPNAGLACGAAGTPSCLSLCRVCE